MNKTFNMSFLESKSVTFDIGGGRMVTIETGKMARQADGAVTVRQGNCIILATVVANKEPKTGQSFFPLSVDYQEKFGSAGRIPGSFFKREARLNDYEILTSRLIDRALRPLFPEDYLCEVQVLVTLVSSDYEVMPDALACLAALTAHGGLLFSALFAAGIARFIVSLWPAVMTAVLFAGWSAWNARLFERKP